MPTAGCFFTLHNGSETISTAADLHMRIDILKHAARFALFCLCRSFRGIELILVNDRLAYQLDYQGGLIKP